MKPSEMLNKMGYLNLKRELSKSETKEINDLGLIEKAVISRLLKKANDDLNNLDKRFIDREELKKVLKKLSEYYQENWDWPGSVFTEEYNKEILELLK